MNFSASNGLLGIDGTLPASSCSGAAKGPEQCAHGHTGIELLRETQAAGMGRICRESSWRHAQIFQVSDIRETRIVHQSLCQLPDQGRRKSEKSEIALGLWIVSGFVREIDFLGRASSPLLVHIGHVIVASRRRGRREQHEKVVPLLCRGLGSSLRERSTRLMWSTMTFVSCFVPIACRRSLRTRCRTRERSGSIEEFSAFFVLPLHFGEREKMAGTHARCESAAPRPF